MEDEERRAPPLAIALFGRLDVRLAGRPLPVVRSQKSQWLLALLALQGGRAVERAWLAGTLWPDSSQRQAAFNLSRNLTDLRQVLGPEAHRLEALTPRTLRLDLVGAEADVLSFDEAIASGDAPALERAVNLHRGPLLEGCHEEWALQERGAREAAYLAALERLATHAQARDDPTAAVQYLRRLVAADPLRDSARRALMQILAQGGDFAAATQVYGEFRLLLHRELNAAPDPETTTAYQQIRAEVRRRLAMLAAPPIPGPCPDAEPARAGCPPGVPSRLPRPLTRLVGRRQEVRAIRARLAAERLVTLTGPGGVGKTRLAIQVAEECRAAFPAGVWFVDLTAPTAPTTGEHPEIVPQAVAMALELREQPGPAPGGCLPLTKTLQQFLRTKQLLLVLDNCEHLLSACAQLAAALLSACPELRILATSRQSLGLTGEVTWPLSGLSVPDIPAFPRSGVPGEPTSEPECLLQFDAVRLFVERAREATAAFALTEGTAGHAVQICRRLDGQPLALELAAARLKALAVHEIAARLDDRFALLTGGSRTAMPRHQTLRAAVDWSYELLAPPEQRLLQRLSVFTGSFSLGAVEVVCSDDELPMETEGHRSRMATGHLPSTGPPRRRPSVSTGGFAVPREAVLDLLTRLVDQSLVTVERIQDRRLISRAGGETGTRYRLLETVRQYALERLRAETPCGAEREEERVRRCHLEFYLRLAEDAGPYLAGPDRLTWLERLEVELDNLRAALDWSLKAVDGQWRVVSPTGSESKASPPWSKLTTNHSPPSSAAEMALRLAAALGGFWIPRGMLEEARERLAAVLERAGWWRGSPAGAAALAHLGCLALLGGDYPTARSRYQESLAIWRELGDPGAIANVLLGLGHVARRQDEYAEARALHEESLAIRRALRDRWGIAQSLIALGATLQEQEDDPSAWAGHYEEALALSRELGDRSGVADALGELANVARRQGDDAQARRYREESLALWRAIGSRLGVIHSLGALGHLARDQGEYGEARAFYTESLRLRQELGDRYTLIQALEDFAELAAAEGEWARTTQLLGAAEAQWERMGKPRPPRERREYDRYLSRARAALGKVTAAAVWAAGRAMALDRAVGYARQDAASEALE